MNAKESNWDGGSCTRFTSLWRRFRITLNGFLFTTSPPGARISVPCGLRGPAGCHLYPCGSTLKPRACLLEREIQLIQRSVQRGGLRGTIEQTKPAGSSPNGQSTERYLRD